MPFIALRLWWCLNFHHGISLFSCLVLSHTHILLVEPRLKSHPLFVSSLVAQPPFYPKIYASFYFMLTCTYFVFWTNMGELWFHFCALCIQNAIFLNHAQILGSSFMFFKKHSFSQTIISFVIRVVGSFWLLASPWEKRFAYHLICNLWIPCIVWFPPIIHHWIDVFDSTHIMRNAHPTEEPLLYWPSKFSMIPFWQWMPMGEKVLRV